MLLFPDISPDQVVKGRRVRLPESLLYSRFHSALAVATYALLDVLGGGRRHSLSAGRDWIARRLGCSVSGLAKALSALMAEHVGDDVTPDVPVLLVSTPRGRGRTAERTTLPGVPWIDIPEWALGDDVDGTRVSHRALRLYAIVLHKRTRAGWVAFGRRDLARLLRCRTDSVPKLLEELAAAGMALVDSRAGQTHVIVPITVEADARRAAAAHAQLAAVRTNETPAQHACEHPVDNIGGGVGEHSSAGTSPCPSAGTSPHPCAGTSIESPDLGSSDLERPLVVGRPSAPARTASPRARTTWNRRLTAAVGTADDAAGHSRRPVRSAPASPASSQAWPAAWCGRCNGPSTRRSVDLDTGFTSGPCPTCGTGRARAA